MRGLIACFAIVCLSLASGAPTEEERKTYFKSYKFDHGDVINTIYPFGKDDFTYAVCEGSDVDKKCKVYVEFNERNSFLSCDLSLKYAGRFDSSVLLTNAGNSKVVFAVKDGETRVKLINVDMNSCRIHEASIEVSKESLLEYNYLFSSYVVPRENNYDVFFRNKELCHDFFCKATFDYEGKVVKAASASAMRDLGFGLFKVEPTDNGFLAFQSTHRKVDIYFVKDDDNQNNVTLFYGPKGGYLLGLSTAENKLGFCALNDQGKPVCKQYDAGSQAKKIETEISFANNQGTHVFRALDILNLEKGFLALVNGYQGKNYDLIGAIAYIDEHGVQGKTVTVDPKCNENVLISKLYKNSSGQYCVNSVCMPTYDDTDRLQFSRTSRCFLKNELF